LKESSTRSGNYRRVVIKLGTSLLTAGSHELDMSVMSQLVEQVVRLQHAGKQIVIVSSGAIAAGRHRLAVTDKNKALLFKQVLASVGQSHLMFAYEQLFGLHHVTIAQALLTRADLTDRHGYLNARNTLLALMELGVIAIVNENDVVATDEIQGRRFGDNDNLSAMVANLVDADLLIILTDIAGLYTADPHQHPEAKLVPVVEHVDESVERLAKGSAGSLGTGGMATKIEAAKLATSSGVPVVIADGREANVLDRLICGEPIGTIFLPRVNRLESRKRWMVSGLSTRGKILVDEGATAALWGKEKSLLPAGIKDVTGDFQRGDIVDIVDPSGKTFACGISNYCSKDIARIKGAQSRKLSSLLGHDSGTEVVHRNNMVLLWDGGTPSPGKKNKGR
jgi:glutamate 5-kinase